MPKLPEVNETPKPAVDSSWDVIDDEAPVQRNSIAQVLWKGWDRFNVRHLLLWMAAIAFAIGGFRGFKAMHSTIDSQWPFLAAWFRASLDFQDYMTAITAGSILGLGIPAVMTGPANSKFSEHPARVLFALCISLIVLILIQHASGITPILGMLGVSVIVALPAQLFLTTGIPACLWFLTRDKTGRNLKNGGRNRQGQTLFIDARKLGSMQTRTLRVLTGGDAGESMLADGLGDPNFDSDLGRIVYAFRQWRGEPAPAWWDAAQHGAWTYRDIPGFCKAETIAGIGKHGFVLTPGRYVGAEVQAEDSEPFSDKYPRLLAELEACFGEGERLMAVVRERLKGVSDAR